MAITFKSVFGSNPHRTMVFLNGKRVGTIKGTVRIVGRATTYRYYPKGAAQPGDSFDSFDACKASLLSDGE